MALMPNIKLLRDAMIATGWHITSFYFPYKSIKYIVLVEDEQSQTSDTDIPYIVRLTFIDPRNVDHQLTFLANSGSINVTLSELRRFFGIAYLPNPGDLYQQFCSSLGRYVPSTCIAMDTTQKIHAVNLLDKRDHVKDQNAIYCYDVRRNPKIDGRQKMRTIYNDNKARILNSRLYKTFGSDKTLSFYYTNDPAKRKSDEDIIQQFADRNQLSTFQQLR